MNLKSLVKHDVDLGHGRSISDVMRSPSIQAMDFSKAEVQAVLDELVQDGAIAFKASYGNYWPANDAAREDAWGNVAKAARGHVSSAEAAQIIAVLKRNR